MAGREEEKEKQKDQEEELTPRELLVKSGGVLDNPFLVALIEAAPSPHAADKHLVRTLGWPLELGKRVRNACRLKEFYLRRERRDEWENIKKSSLRPAEALFDFSEDRENILIFDTGTIAETSASIRFDEWHNENAIKPLLLKEFWFKDHNKSTIFTTIDGNGFGGLLKVKQSELLNFLETAPAWPYLFYSERKVYSREIKNGSIAVQQYDGDKGQTTSYGDQASCFYYLAIYRKNKPSYYIAGGTIMELPDSGEVWPPRLVKLLNIWGLGSDDKIHDSISLMFYADALNDVQYKKVGDLIFRRKIGQAAGSHAVLSANYHVVTGQCTGGCYSVYSPGRLLRDNGHLVSIRMGINDLASEDSMTDFFRSMDKTLSALNGWAEKICQAGYEDGISLEKIAGRSFLENPPEELIDFFV